ncbi:MAG: cytidine deaminase [Chitinophagales bacterium]|nr:cytidine deaminase [Chitinophagales bacterium]MDW8393656.1 cytidine deaminase [Chitinophagales bacterium]
MNYQELTIRYAHVEEVSALENWQQDLLNRAWQAVDLAYAPYSRFRVGAAVLLDNGAVVLGSNQENASSPAGLCAERTALSVAAMQYPAATIRAVAIRARNDEDPPDSPVAPCGICRQTLLEYELRQNHNIELLLQGAAGPVVIIGSVKDLLPLYFWRQPRRQH